MKNSCSTTLDLMNCFEVMSWQLFISVRRKRDERDLRGCHSRDLLSCGPLSQVYIQ